MKLIEKYKNGKISKAELLSEARRDQKIRAQVATLLDEKLSEEELGAIAAAGEQGCDLTGSRFKDFFVGSDYDDTFDGLGGDDVIGGGKGNDLLTGGEGNDTFQHIGGDGNDTITDFTLGEDEYVLVGLNAHDFTIRIDGDNTILTTVDGEEITFQNVHLEHDDITINSWAPDDDQPDFIAGGDGDDTISGGSGDDTIEGGAGDDSLHGYTGNDAINGGEGNDVYVWLPNLDDGTDTFDGGDGEDSIQLHGYRGSVQDTIANGDVNLELFDADGNSIPQEDWTYDADGNLLIPEGATGTLSSDGGAVLNFSNVEMITPQENWGR